MVIILQTLPPSTSERDWYITTHIGAYDNIDNWKMVTDLPRQFNSD